MTMSSDWMLADYRRPGTHRIYDYREPSIDEVLSGAYGTTGESDVAWDAAGRIRYRPILAMAVIDSRPDPPPGTTFFIRYFRETWVEEAVTADEVARRLSDLLHSGTTYGYDFQPPRPRL